MLPRAIARWRTEREITQRQLARRVGVSVATIARIETGDLRPSWFTLVEIANALEVGVDVIALIRTRPAVEAVA